MSISDRPDQMEHVIEHAAQVMWRCDNPGLHPAWVERSWRDAGESGERAEYELRARALAEAGYLTAAVSRDDIDRALINVTSNAMNYPTPSQMLGKDSGPLRKKCVDAVCDLFGIEADPIEAKAWELLEGHRSTRRILGRENHD